MFQEFESNMTELQKKYNNCTNQKNTYNKILFNELDRKDIDYISKINTEFSESDINNTFHRIYSVKKILKDIYLFNISNPENCNEKMNDVDKIIKFIHESLKKFQWVVGGYLIEDYFWTTEKNKSKRFKINEKESILYNTLEYYDDETEIFMDKFIDYINNFVDKSAVKVRYAIKEDELMDLKFVIITIKLL